MSTSPADVKKTLPSLCGRYIRRLPLSQRRILEVTPHEVVYQSKDTRTKTFLDARRKPEDLVAMLSVHVLDRYQHSMRYFGLLAPRTKAQTFNAVFSLLGQTKRPRPVRQSWVESLRKRFGVDPLVDSFGERMHWTGRERPRANAVGR